LHYVLRHTSLDAPNFFNNKAGTRPGVDLGFPRSLLLAAVFGASRSPGT
jgi:hypothetical protein